MEATTPCRLFLLSDKVHSSPRSKAVEAAYMGRLDDCLFRLVNALGTANTYSTATCTYNVFRDSRATAYPWLTTWLSLT